jgi:TRAP-type mannitol/chloroaromatic compound transport system permease large subunit
MKYGQKLKIGDAHVTPRNIQKVQASKLGDAQGTPFFIGKNQVTFQDTIFLLLYILCIFLGASLLSLSVFFCFVCCNKWLDHLMFVLKRDTLCFIVKNTLVFTPFVQRVFSFSSTAFGFHFSP